MQWKINVLISNKLNSFDINNRILFFRVDSLINLTVSRATLVDTCQVFIANYSNVILLLIYYEI